MKRLREEEPIAVPSTSSSSSTRPVRPELFTQFFVANAHEARAIVNSVSGSRDGTNVGTNVHTGSYQDLRNVWDDLVRNPDVYYKHISAAMSGSTLTALKEHSHSMDECYSIICLLHDFRYPPPPPEAGIAMANEKFIEAIRTRVDTWTRTQFVNRCLAGRMNEETRFRLTADTTNSNLVSWLVQSGYGKPKECYDMLYGVYDSIPTMVAICGEFLRYRPNPLTTNIPIEVLRRAKSRLNGRSASPNTSPTSSPTSSSTTTSTTNNGNGNSPTPPQTTDDDSVITTNHTVSHHFDDELRQFLADERIRALVVKTFLADREPLVQKLATQSSDSCLNGLKLANLFPTKVANLSCSSSNDDGNNSSDTIEKLIRIARCNLEYNDWVDARDICVTPTVCSQLVCIGVVPSTEVSREKLLTNIPYRKMICDKWLTTPKEVLARLSYYQNAKVFELLIDVALVYEHCLEYTLRKKRAVIQQQPTSSQTSASPSPTVEVCSVCLDSPRNAVFVPCGHLHCCIACAKIIASGSAACPICRAHIVQTIQVYQ